jgi:eukaryotic-like serine/threonine-protein kinase
LFNRSLEGLRIAPATGLGTPREVLRRPLIWASDWSTDGRYIAYTYDERHIIGVRRLNPEGDLDLPFSAAAENFNARFSPDGRWLAYTSNESGRYDVYVLAFPNAGAKWKISTNGGAQSVWRRDARELFYVAADGQLMSVAVTPQAATPFAKPVALFEAPLIDRIAPSFDVSRDGQKLLLNVSSSPVPGKLNIVTNWTALLQK